MQFQFSPSFSLSKKAEILDILAINSPFSQRSLISCLTLWQCWWAVSLFFHGCPHDTHLLNRDENNRYVEEKTSNFKSTMCPHGVCTREKRREVAIDWNTTVLKLIGKKHMTKTHNGFGGSLFLLLKLLCSFLGTKATYANCREKGKHRQEK